jgi:hypothetical protein
MLSVRGPVGYGERNNRSGSPKSPATSVRLQIGDVKSPHGSQRGLLRIGCTRGVRK